MGVFVFHMASVAMSETSGAHLSLPNNAEDSDGQEEQQKLSSLPYSQ
jgi:hypothetical protein